MRWKTVSRKSVATTTPADADCMGYLQRTKEPCSGTNGSSSYKVRLWSDQKHVSMQQFVAQVAVCLQKHTSRLSYSLIPKEISKKHEKVEDHFC
jgi:hypothetical protein